MAHKELIRIMIGFKKFREKFFSADKNFYEKLSVGGQSPKTLIIGCSDSRVDPAILTSASPGDLFVVRNVANLVPPYETAGGHHGVSAAIEFATVQLKVENIIILGHRQCGGIRALMSQTSKSTPNGEHSFINTWVQIAKPAKERVLEKHSEEDFENQCRHCEKESVRISLENLQTFPFVREAIQNRNLNLIGVYFDLENGDLLEYDFESQGFKSIDFLESKATL